MLQLRQPHLKHLSPTRNSSSSRSPGYHIAMMISKQHNRMLGKSKHRMKLLVECASWPWIPLVSFIGSQKIKEQFVFQTPLCVYTRWKNNGVGHTQWRRTEMECSHQTILHDFIEHPQFRIDQQRSMGPNDTIAQRITLQIRWRGRWTDSNKCRQFAQFIL